MSVHSHSKWTLEDPIEDAPISEISECVKHHGCMAPMVYAICSVADNFIYNVGNFLFYNRGKPLTKELIEEHTPAEMKDREKTIEVAVKVLEHMEFLGTVQPRPEPKPFKLDKFVIPKINRPWPKLFG